MLRTALLKSAEQSTDGKAQNQVVLVSLFVLSRILHLPGAQQTHPCQVLSTLTGCWLQQKQQRPSSREQGAVASLTQVAQLCNKPRPESSGMY